MRQVVSVFVPESFGKKKTQRRKKKTLYLLTTSGQQQDDDANVRGNIDFGMAFVCFLEREGCLECGSGPGLAGLGRGERRYSR